MASSMREHSSGPGGGRYLVQEDSLGEIRLELVLEAKGLFVAKSRAIGNTI